MNLSQLDLNLLIVLKQLLEEKHVTNTALSLSISQPTVSRSLNKLRKLFNDQLLIRAGSGYDLTPKAEFIQQELHKLLGHLETLIEGEEFDPKSSNKIVKFFGLSPHMDTFGARIVQRIHQEAPNMVIDIDTTPKPHFLPLLSGDVHFVISLLQPATSEQNIYMTRLFSQHFRLLMSKDHPLADQELTADLLSQCRFGQLSIQGDKLFTLESRFKSLGLNKQQRISSPVKLNSFSGAAAIAESTDIIFHLPAQYAESLSAARNLVVRHLPAELKNSALSEANLYWHKRHHNDPMCSWVRGLIKEIAAEEEGISFANSNYSHL